MKEIKMKEYVVEIKTNDNADFHQGIKSALANKLSEVSTLAQTEMLAKLVSGSVIEACSKKKNEECDCEDPENCECDDDDDDEDLTEATSFKKLNAKQFTELSSFKSFVALYQKENPDVEVKKQQLLGKYKWFVYCW